MNGVFHETFAIDLPSETTCYSAGPFSRRYNLKRVLQIIRPLPRQYDEASCGTPISDQCSQQSSPMALRIATSQQIATLFVPRNHKQRDFLDYKIRRFHDHLKPTSRCVAYTAFVSQPFYPLEAYIVMGSLERSVSTQSANPQETHVVDMSTKNKAFTLTIRAQSSYFYAIDNTSTLLNNQGAKYNLSSELELSYTPLALHLCPLTTPTTLTTGPYHALLSIGCMEEPFLKTYIICISSTPTSTLVPSMSIHEVNNHYLPSHATALTIPAHLTPCFNPTPTTTTVATTQEGVDSFLPSSYWDALLSQHVHSFLSSGSNIDQSTTQQPVSLQKSNYQSFLPLAFSSPVMGMHSLIIQNHPCTKTDIYYLAFSCQDGTIRVVTCTLNSESASFSFPQYHILNVSDMIVDGPILCITLSISRRWVGSSNTSPKVLLTIGSLCGTACQFFQNDPYRNFEGPETIVSSLWNHSIDTEDAVTAVECYDSIVAVGTCSGRIFLFKHSGYEITDHESSSWYCLTMEQNLHYPIHSIWIEDVDEDGMIEMLICTRKSVHLFRGSRLKSLADKIRDKINI